MMLDTLRELTIVDLLQCQVCGNVWRQERFCCEPLSECECPRCDAAQADWLDANSQCWNISFH